MRQMLITGATGNIGTEVILYIAARGTDNQIIAGVRNIAKAKLLFPDLKDLDYCKFNFENPHTFDVSLEDRGELTATLLKALWLSRKTPNKREELIEEKPIR